MEAGFRYEYKGFTKVKGKEPMQTYLILPPPADTWQSWDGQLYWHSHVLVVTLG